MKILIGVHQFFPKYYTGTERYALNLAKQLQRMGHTVKVLTYAFKEVGDGFRDSCTSDVLREEYSYEGIPVIAMKHKQQPDDLAFLFDFMDTAIYNETKRIFEQDHFDIYHCTHPLRIASSIKAARDSGVKVVFMVTDYFLMCPQGIMLRSNNTLCDGPNRGENCLKYCFVKVENEQIQKRLSCAQQLIECSNYLLSPSRFLVELFNYTGFVPASRFILSPHGFDYTTKKEYFRKNPGDVITFGYIGTIQYHKGVHIMIEGFKKTRHRNIRLQVWGGCYYELEYQKRVMKIAAKDSRIEFKGTYNYNDIENVLRHIDVIIVPSIWYENAPLTIITSLAYGIPVITSAIGGMCEMITNNQNGLTFKVGSALDLSEKISRIAKDPNMIRSFNQNIRYPIRMEEEAFNTEQIYKTLI